MKQLCILLTMGGLVIAALATAPRAVAGFGFEDPGLCVTQKLLVAKGVIPTQAYVRVPVGTATNTRLISCADPTLIQGLLAPISKANVSERADLVGEMIVRVNVPAGTRVTFTYNGITKIKRNNLHNFVRVRFPLP